MSNVLARKRKYNYIEGNKPAEINNTVEVVHKKNNTWNICDSFALKYAVRYAQNNTRI